VTAAATEVDRPRAGRELRLLDASDTPWIAAIVDELVRGAGERWGSVQAEIERLEVASPPRIASIVQALRRLCGGRARNAAAARRARALVLGAPALDRDARRARIACAASALGVGVEAVEQMLWSDLAHERPVVLPERRPDACVLAALANERTIQRALRRAHDVTIRVWGDPRHVLHAAAARGLIAAVARDGDATTLDISGPLAMLHQTAVYGRALAGLVPYIAACDEFELALRCDFGRGEIALRVPPTALLPPGASRVRWRLVDRLAAGLGKAGLVVDRDPPPLVAGAQLAIPDLAFERAGARIHVEVIGFWTEPYLATKLARYRAAGALVVLCLDGARMHADDTPPPRVPIVLFTRSIAVDALLAVADDALRGPPG